MSRNGWYIESKDIEDSEYWILFFKYKLLASPDPKVQIIIFQNSKKNKIKFVLTSRIEDYAFSINESYIHKCI